MSICPDFLEQSRISRIFLVNGTDSPVGEVELRGCTCVSLQDVVSV